MSRYLFLSCYVTLCSFGVLRSQSLFDEYDFRCEERRDQKIAAKLQLYEDKIKALENQIKSIDLKNQQGELVYSNYGKKLFRLCKNLGTLRKMSPCQTSVCVILVLSMYRFRYILKECDFDHSATKTFGHLICLIRGFFL